MRKKVGQNMKIKFILLEVIILSTKKNIKNENISEKVLF